MRVAPGLFAVGCRATKEGAAPGCVPLAVWGAAFAATLAAEVTTFGVAASLARPVLGAAALLVATAGASPGVAFVRRTALGVGLGEVASVAVMAGVGLPVRAAVWVLAVS